MVVDSVRAGVISVVYEHSGGTLENLLYLIDKALDGQKAQSVGIFSDGDSREINLLEGKMGWERTLFAPMWSLSTCMALSLLLKFRFVKKLVTQPEESGRSVQAAH